MKHKPILVLVLAFALTEYAAPAQDTQPATFEKEIIEIRKLSGLTYYADPHSPIRRSISSDGKNGLRLGSKHVWNQYYWSKDVTRESKRSAVDKAVELIKKLQQAAAGEQETAQLSLLRPLAPGEGDGWFIGDISYRYEDRNAVYDGYRKNPSSVLAVVYVELALLYLELGEADKYRHIVVEAVEELKLDKADYATDVEFRKRCPSEFNFGRPESCLLFLRARESMKQDNAEVAIGTFTHLIEIDPAGPYSWEAFVWLHSIKADSATINKSRKLLLDQFPSVWGCKRPGIGEPHMDKADFSVQLPLLVARVQREIESQ